MFTHTRRLAQLGLGLGALAALPTNALAATTVTTFAVTAAVQATCNISADPLSFGTYSGATLDATSSIFVTCTAGTGWEVGLNQGTGSGATVTSRFMTGPSPYTLDYALYQDSAHTINWGNTVGTDTKSGTGSGSTQNLTVYGVIPGGHFPGPGSYSDTITATLSF